MEKKDDIFKPCVSWINETHENKNFGKIGSVKNNDPVPVPIQDYYHPTGFISLSAEK